MYLKLGNCNALSYSHWQLVHTQGSALSRLNILGVLITIRRNESDTERRLALGAQYRDKHDER